jgi:phosphatidylglycerol:prolipoprotein diacylglycerol transferase
MHPYLFQVPLPWGGTFKLPSYGFMIMIGFLLCLWLFGRRGKKMGLAPEALFDAATVALLGGIVGARLFYVIGNWESFADSPLTVFALWHGGLSFFGGLAGGALGLLAMLAKHKLPLLRTLDAAASLVPLGHAFGRVGCFLNGCCYGKVTAAWTGVCFPRFLDARGQVTGSPTFYDQLGRGLVNVTDAHSLPVHPTQLYEVAFELAFFAVLSYMLPRRRRDGDVAWTYGLLYGSARFVNEFFRADTMPVPQLGGLTAWHAMAAGVALFGVIMLVRSLRRPPEPLPPVA